MRSTGTPTRPVTSFTLAQPAMHAWRPPLVASVVVGVFLLAAAVPGLLTPRDPYAIDFAQRLLPPALDSAHPLGTDAFGRDILSRIIHGARFSLGVVAAALGLAGVVGVVVGLAAGYLGGWVDVVLMRLTDAAISIPVILVAMAFGVARNPSATNVVIVIGGFMWAQYARVIRADVVRVAQEQFVAGARAAGVSTLRILTHHIFPGIIPTVIVLLTSHAGSVVILAASLSFLGTGVPPPAPEWGTLVADGRDLVFQAWWVSMMPGFAILATVLSLNFLGDWVRDALDIRTTV